MIAATVGNDEPYNLSQTSCRVLQKADTRSGFGLYISMMSRPALNTLSDEEVSIRPRHLFFSNSVKFVEMDESRSKFKLLTGGRCRVSVATPLFSFTDTLVNFVSVLNVRYNWHGFSNFKALFVAISVVNQRVQR